MDVAAVHSGSGFVSLPPVTPVTKPVAQPQEGRAQSPESQHSGPTPTVPDRKTLEKELAFANSVAELFDKKVSFSYDERIQQFVVKVTQNDREEVIRQIPAEEMIQLRLRLKENFQGMILNHAG